MTLLETALLYRNHFNFSIIPCKKDKKPLLESWKEFQNRIATEKEVIDWWSKYPDANIGIVTGVVSHLAVVDIDTDEGEENVLPYLTENDSFLTPKVTTPRGGQHLYFYNDDIKLSNNAGIFKGCDLRANGGYVLAPPSQNAEGKQYSWVYDLDKMPLKKLPNSYLIYINKHNLYIESNVTNCDNFFTEGRRDEDIFHIANQLKKARTNPEIMRKALYLIGDGCNPPYSHREIDEKIKSASKRLDTKDLNMTELVENWISGTEGIFTLGECHKGVTSMSQDVNLCHIPSQDSSTFRMIFTRLKARGLIVTAGNKNGTFKKVDTVAEEINWMDSPTDSLDIRYPFGIEQLFPTYPKNIIVLAGSPNSGKTAFLLNFVKENMDKHEIHYFSSEMGGTELKSRLQNFDIPLKDWKFKAKERVSDFSSVIFPDAINIIDYMELLTDVYKVGVYLQEIYQKLNKGIAIIAIQKAHGREMGRGAEFSLEKPRLYLSMESGRIKIVKCKAWVDKDLNPNGLCKDFKLVMGSKIIDNHSWYPEVAK